MALKPPKPETEKILIELQEEQKQLQRSINRISNLAAEAEVKGLFPFHNTDDLYNHTQVVNAGHSAIRGEIQAMKKSLCQCGCRRCCGTKLQTYSHYNIEKGGMIKLKMCHSCRHTACGPHVKSDDSQRHIPEKGWDY